MILTTLCVITGIIKMLNTTNMQLFYNIYGMKNPYYIRYHIF